MANTVAYGFVPLAHMMNERIADGNVERVWQAIRDTAVEHTRQMNEMLGLFARRGTERQIRYMQPSSGTMQTIGPDGSPLPTRHEGYYDVAFPIIRGGDAWGDNRETRALMTVEEANRRMLTTQQRDAEWMRRHMLGAFFDNVDYTYADPLYGNLTVRSLANGDAVTYPNVSGTPAVDTHQGAQAADISDAATPFDDIYDELTEHPVNANAEIVVYTPQNLRADIRGLTDFVDVGDPDIRYGVNTDQVGSTIALGPGHRLLGKCEECWIVEWRNLPSSYMLAVAQGAQDPALYMREQPSASLQGLITETFDEDGNHQGTRFIRINGFGVLNRVGAVVWRVGDASYAIPSGYDVPMTP